MDAPRPISDIGRYRESLYFLNEDEALTLKLQNYVDVRGTLTSRPMSKKNKKFKLKEKVKWYFKQIIV